MALELRQIHVAYGRQPVLRGLDLRVPEGACYGLLGGNGAGKTTAMRVALGLLTPDRGQVLIDGFDPAEAPLEARARTAGLLEIPGFFPALSARTNLSRLAALAGVPAAGRAREVQRWLEIVGLTAAADRPAGHFSQGMRQRLGLAQALISGARNLLLDEPMNGLDPRGIAEIREVIRRLVREEGKTVLVSSHQLKELEGLCDSIGILHAGRVVREGALGVLLGEADRIVAIESLDRGRLERALQEFGPAVEVMEGLGHGSSLVRAKGLPFDQLLRALIDRGVPVSSFHPHKQDLETLYLQSIAQAERAEARGEAPVAASAPLEGSSVAPRPSRIAPRGSWWRALRYEARRVFGSPIQLLLIAAPALVGAFAARGTTSGAEGQLYEPSALEALGAGIRAGLPLLALVLLSLGALSIASERGYGTLKNVLTAPVRRIHVFLAKFCVLAIATLLGYGALYLGAFAVADATSPWRGPGQLLENGIFFEIAPLAELEPLVHRLLHEPLLPLFAIASLGMLAGSFMNRSLSALGLALAAFIGSILLQVPGRSFGFEAYLPTTYLPTLLAQTSWVDVYASLVEGAADAQFLYAAERLPALSAWILLAALASAVLFQRRPVR